MRLPALIAVFSLLLPLQQASDPTDIVRRADELLRGDTHRGVYRMEITTPRWSRSLTMRVWSEGTENFLVRIDQPAQDAGTGFLKIDNEVWTYLPNVEKTIKVPPSMMHQEWMGSDFTNDDLVKQSSILRDYTQHMVGEETLDGVPVWHIRLEPREGAPVVWGLLHLWIQKDGYIMRREDFHDQNGALVNRMTLDEVKRMGGRRIPTRYTMAPLEEEGHRTVLHILEAEFDMPLPSNFFTLQNLRRIR